MSSSYISRAACHGRRPAQFVSESGQQRAHLIARLLKERMVARFIVAPTGYGKTLLALDYAETIFDWQHTFWFSAKSPCFIRDLDAQKISQSCLEADPQAALVVFDDVPYLDPTRAELFSNQIDTLLEAGCEIIVITYPICDILGSFQHDRICLNANDLLLSDEEIESFLYKQDRKETKAQDIPFAHRVPALIWGTQGEGMGETAFKKQLLSDEMPQDLYNIMITLLVLQSADMKTIESITYVDNESLLTLRQNYPHLGIDEALNVFNAVPIEIDLIAPAMKSRLDEIVERSKYDSTKALLEAWTDALVRLNNAPRACELMRSFNVHQETATWLIAHIRELIRNACFYQMLLIARNTNQLSLLLKSQLRIAEALCCQILGDVQTALMRARQVAHNKTLPSRERICAFLILSKLGTQEDDEQARAFFDEVMSDMQDDLAEQPSIDQEGELKFLVAMKQAAYQGITPLIDTWKRIRSAHASDDVVSIGASWILTLHVKELQEETSDISPLQLNDVQAYVRMRMNDSRVIKDFFAISAALSLEDAYEHGLANTAGMLNAPILFGLRQFELLILSQRAELAREQREQELHQSDWSRAHPDGLLWHAGASDTQSLQRIPRLSLRLFGTFEVAIGDTSINDRGALKNQNARTMLAILAVNRGKDISRESIAHAIWPESNETVAKKNFYTTWSRLRQALELPDGTCPYLIRHQYGCSLAWRYVVSDVERFHEICRALLFGSGEHTDWAGLFEEIDRDFSSDLLPGETRNEIIIASRREYRDKLVDSLVNASVGVLDAGEPKWGICFAREALHHDETREDAYVALMRSQMAFSQRTSAIMTFLRCQKMLGEHLGIDPSPETTVLYQELLAGDEALNNGRNGSMAKP